MVMYSLQFWRIRLVRTKKQHMYAWQCLASIVQMTVSLSLFIEDLGERTLVKFQYLINESSTFMTQLSPRNSKS